MTKGTEMRRIIIEDKTPGPLFVRRLIRQLKEHKSPVRYLICSSIGRSHRSFYDIASHTYILGNPKNATLFKQKAFAETIARLLSSHTNVIQCRVSSKGRLILSSLPPDIIRSYKQWCAA